MNEKGSIGKRYRRMDKAGTPLCITIDSEPLGGEGVTFATGTHWGRYGSRMIRGRRSSQSLSGGGDNLQPLPLPVAKP